MVMYNKIFKQFCFIYVYEVSVFNVYVSIKIVFYNYIVL